MNVVIQSIDNMEQRNRQIDQNIRRLRDRDNDAEDGALESFGKIMRNREIQKRNYRWFEQMKGRQGRSPDEVLKEFAKAKSYSPVYTRNTIQSPPTLPKNRMESNKQMGRVFDNGDNGLNEEVKYQLEKEKARNQQKLNKVDFNYIFFSYDQRDKLQPKIDKINKVRSNPNIQKQLKQSFSNLTSTFVMTQLNKNIDEELNISQNESKSLNQNKVTWSKMFMKQEKIQKLLTEYFEKINTHVQNEVLQNKTQLRDFLRFPRKLKSYHGKQPVDLPPDFSKQVTQQDVTSYSSAELSKLDDQDDQLTSYNKNRSHRSRSNSKEGTDSLRQSTLKQTLGLKSRKSSVTFASDTMPKFINDLPDSLKAKNPELIERVAKLYKTNKNFSETFKKIVKSNKLMFTEKIEKLEALNEEYEQRECDERHRNEIRESLARIEDQILDIDNDRKDMEEQLINLEDQSQRKKLDAKRPTEKLMNKLVDWFADLESYKQDPVDQELFANKMWRIFGDFEEELRIEEKGHHIQLKRLKNVFQQRESELKLHYSLRIEALEMALNQLKLDSQREINQAQMQINEMESFQMNLTIQGKFKEIEQFLITEQKEFAEQGIVEDSYQDKIKFLLAQNFKYGMNKSKMDTMKMRSENKSLNKFILNKLKKYVRMMEVQKLKEFTLQDQLSQFKLNRQQITLHHDEMHHKCVQYQNLFNSMLSLYTDTLFQLKCISSRRKDKILDSCQLEEAKLTLDLDKIESTRVYLANLQSEDHLQKITKKMVDSMGLVKKLGEIMSNEKTKEFIKQVKGSFEEDEDEEEEDEILETNGQENETQKQINLLFSTISKILKSFNIDELVQEEQQSEEESQSLRNDLISIREHENESQQQASYRPPQKAEHAKPLQLRHTKKPTRLDKKVTKKDKKSKQATIQPKIQDPELDYKSKTQAPGLARLSIAQNARKNQTMRVGIFDETVDYLIKSLSKKKIYYQMDQITAKEVAAFCLQNFNMGTRNNSICSQIFKANSKDSLKITINSGGGTGTDQYSLSLSDEEKEAQYFDSVEEIIKNINENIQNYYKQLQMKQQSEEGAVPNYSRQKILPIDCIRIDQYQAPQFNVMPFKLLLLRKDVNQALTLFSNTLNIISNFFDVTPYELDPQSKYKLDIRKRMRRNQHTQCNITSGDDGLTQYERTQEALIEAIDQEIIKLDKLKFQDQAFIDEKQEDDRVLKMLKASLIYCKEENGFINDINSRILSELKEAKLAPSEKQEEVIKKLTIDLEQVQEELKQSKVDLEQLEISLKQKDIELFNAQKTTKKIGQETGKSKAKTMKPCKKRQSKLNAQQNGTLEVDERSDITNINIVSSGDENQNANGQKKSKKQKASTLKLRRAPEIIQQGYNDLDESALNEMDEMALLSFMEKQATEQKSKMNKNKESSKKDLSFSPDRSLAPNLRPPFNGLQIPSEEKQSQQIYTQTEINMHDIELMLDYKQRSTNKILSLEDQIRAIKMDQIREAQRQKGSTSQLSMRDAPRSSLEYGHRRNTTSVNFYRNLFNQQSKRLQDEPYSALPNKRSMQLLPNCMKPDDENQYINTYDQPSPLEIENFNLNQQSKVNFVLQNMPELIFVDSQEQFQRKPSQVSTTFLNDKINTDVQTVEGGISKSSRPNSAAQPFTRNKRGGTEIFQTQQIDSRNDNLRKQASKFLLKQEDLNNKNNLYKYNNKTQSSSTRKIPVQRKVDKIFPNKRFSTQVTTPNNQQIKERKSSQAATQENSMKEHASLLKSKHRIRRQQQINIQQKLGSKNQTRNQRDKFKVKTQNQNSTTNLSGNLSNEKLKNIPVTPYTEENGPMDYGMDYTEQAEQVKQDAQEEDIKSYDEDQADARSLGEDKTDTYQLLVKHQNMQDQPPEVYKEIVNIQDRQESPGKLSDESSPSNQRRKGKVILSYRSNQKQMQLSVERPPESQYSPRNKPGEPYNIAVNNEYSVNFIEDQQQDGEKPYLTGDDTESQHKLTAKGMHTHDSFKGNSRQEINKAIKSMPQKLVQEHKSRQHPGAQRLIERPRTSNYVYRMLRKDQQISSKRTLIEQNIVNNIMDDFRFEPRDPIASQYKRSFSKVPRIESSKKIQTSSSIALLTQHQQLMKRRQHSATGSMNLATSASRQQKAGRQTKHSLSNFELNSQVQQLSIASALNAKVKDVPDPAML